MRLFNYFTLLLIWRNGVIYFTAISIPTHELVVAMEGDYVSFWLGEVEGNGFCFSKPSQCLMVVGFFTSACFKICIDSWLSDFAIVTHLIGFVICSPNFIRFLLKRGPPALHKLSIFRMKGCQKGFIGVHSPTEILSVWNFEIWHSIWEYITQFGLKCFPDTSTITWKLLAKNEVLIDFRFHSFRVSYIWNLIEKYSHRKISSNTI